MTLGSHPSIRLFRLPCPHSAYLPTCIRVSGPVSRRRTAHHPSGLMERVVQTQPDLMLMSVAGWEVLYNLMAGLHSQPLLCDAGFDIFSLWAVLHKMKRG